jgi:hypothetical protein
MPGDEGDQPGEQAPPQQPHQNQAMPFMQPIGQPLEHLTIKKGTIKNWKIWKQRWQNYYIITKLDKQEQPYQRAMFLQTIGPEALEIYNGFDLAEDATVIQIIEKFDSFAIGSLNETYERYVFNKRDQKPGESFDMYLTALRSLAKTCNLCNFIAD